MSEQGDRLRKYRDYLGLSIQKAAAHYRVPRSNWGYSESEGQSLPAEILAALENIPAPAGKEQPDIGWLLTGSGSMIHVTDVLPNREADIKTSIPGNTYATSRSTPGFPEKEIIQATEMVYQMRGAGRLSPTKMGHYISTVAELLVRGRSPEEIRERVAPAIRDLAHEGALPPGASP